MITIYKLYFLVILSDIYNAAVVITVVDIVIIIIVIFITVIIIIIIDILSTTTQNTLIHFELEANDDAFVDFMAECDDDNHHCTNEYYVNVNMNVNP